MNMKSSVLCMIIIVVSFLGFLVENVWLAITKGFIDNRNMCLPFLLGDGLAVAGIYKLLGTPRKMMLFGKHIVTDDPMKSVGIYFSVVFVFVCVGEIALGKLMEGICHFCWWDYSRIPMHITQYTSVPTSIAFSCLIVFFMYFLFEPLGRFFASWDSLTLYVTAAAGMCLLICDCGYNLYRMYVDESLQCRWRIEMMGLHQFLHCN